MAAAANSALLETSSEPPHAHGVAGVLVRLA